MCWDMNEKHSEAGESEQSNILMCWDMFGKHVLFEPTLVTTIAPAQQSAI